MKCCIEIVVALITSVSIALNAAAEDTSIPDSAQLAKCTPLADGFSLHASAVRKLDAGKHLSSQEYRSLEAGCVGYEAHHTFFEDIATIMVVYQNSPAAKAGIKVGDQIVAPEEAEDEKFEANPTQSREKVKCGRANTPVDVTVLRDGKPVTITLLRMNIEDIKEPVYRHNWEEILRRLGYPQEGSFSGTSLKDLTPVEP